MTLYRAVLAVLDALLGVVSRRTLHRLDRLPRQGAAVVVCNHISLADPLVLACALGRVGRPTTFLAQAEAFRWPVVGPLLRRTGQVPVVRCGADAAEALRPAGEVLARGGLIGLYPEGRVTTQPDYRPMPQARTGAVRLALAAGCPIVPVAQWGAHRLITREHDSALLRPLRVVGWLRPGRVPRRPRIDLIVGEPISVAELRAAAGLTTDAPVEAPADLAAATALVMGRIRALLAEIAADDLPHLLGASDACGLSDLPPAGSPLTSQP